jgi:hypothetical protein
LTAALDRLLRTGVLSSSGSVSEGLALRHRRRDYCRRGLRPARPQRPPREARRRVHQEGEGRLDQGPEAGEVDLPSGVTPRVIALAGAGAQHRPERAIGMAGTRNGGGREAFLRRFERLGRDVSQLSVARGPRM